MDKVYHTLDAVYDKNSRILILGSMPSPKSREYGFYYMHPQNRFWKIIQDIFKVSLNTVEDRKRFLLLNKIALWDVLESCEITGADDSSIKNVTINDIYMIIKNSEIKTVFTLGRKAEQMYLKHCVSKTNLLPVYLPSPSPANCKAGYEELVKKYSVIKSCLKGENVCNTEI